MEHTPLKMPRRAVFMIHDVFMCYELVRARLRWPPIKTEINKVNPFCIHRRFLIFIWPILAARDHLHPFATCSNSQCLTCSNNDRHGQWPEKGRPPSTKSTKNIQRTIENTVHNQKVTKNSITVGLKLMDISFLDLLGFLKSMVLALVDVPPLTHTFPLLLLLLTGGFYHDIFLDMWRVYWFFGGENFAWCFFLIFF